MDLNRQWPRNARQVTAAPAQAAVRCSPPIYLIAARTAVRAAGGLLAAAASARGLKRRADGRDAEDRNLRRDLLEFTQRGMAIDRDVGPGSRCRRRIAGRAAAGTSSRRMTSRRPWRSTARPSAARTLCTQLAFAPSIA